MASLGEEVGGRVKEASSQFLLHLWWTKMLDAGAATRAASTAYLSFSLLFFLSARCFSFLLELKPCEEDWKDGVPRGETLHKKLSIKKSLPHSQLLSRSRGGEGDEAVIRC